jgi:hypothetical protein
VIRHVGGRERASKSMVVVAERVERVEVMKVPWLKRKRREVDELWSLTAFSAVIGVAELLSGGSKRHA